MIRLAHTAQADDRAACEAWRAAAIEHEIAWQRALAAWERLDEAGTLHRLTSAADPLSSTDLLSRAAVCQPAPDGPMSDRAGPAQAGPVPASLQKQPRWLALAASIALVAIGVPGIGWALFGASTAYATAVGERRLIRLDDGTGIELNTDSRVRLRRQLGKRALVVERGEVMVTLPAGGRPLHVVAASQELDLDAGRLAVRIDGAQVVVALDRGRADLAVEGRNAVPLRAGAQATVSADDIAIAPLRSGEFGRKTAWSGGRIALSGDTLAQAVAEFNRYGNTRLTIGDPSIAGLQVGGIFDIRDVEGFAQAVSRAFPVAVRRQADGSLVLAARPMARGSP